MKEVLKALRPVRARLRRNRFLRGLAFGLAAGLGLAAALQAAAFLVPLEDRGLWAAALAGAAVLLTAAVNALRPLRNRTAAEAADDCGLEERAVTALEAGEEEIRRLQRQDACEALRRLDVKKIRPGSVKKPLLAALCCAAVLGVLLAVPSPQDGKAGEQKALRQTLREGGEQIAQAAEEDEAGLPEEQRTELRRITGDLRRDLAASRDPADALVALDRAEQRLERLRERTAGDALAGAAGSTGDETGRQGEGRTGEGGDGEAPGGNTDGTGQEGKAQQAGKPGTGAPKTQAAVSGLKTAVNPSARQAQQGENASGGSKKQGSAGSAGSRGQQGSSSTAAGQESADSQSGGMPGAGMGNQGQQSGNGAGTGSTNLEQKGAGENSGGISAGNRDPKYSRENYETIYDPERTEAAFRDTETNLERLESGDSVQAEAGPGQGRISGDVPWGEALGEYAETEARSADRENLTPQERQWVTDYFTLLSEQR